ncbi:MAG: hypothetical protein USCAAHI_01208 [Beijerinckiaceae bacterium]|nr:MAG: hypothetical protein USCAAHI_01208 [Beijerinckiaceae bacterium]
MTPHKGKIERNAEIAALRRNGIAFIEIAKKFGLTKQRVEQICSVAGVKPPQKPRLAIVSDFSQDAALGETPSQRRKSRERAEMIRRCRNGERYDDIAASLGVDRSTVVRAWRKAKAEAKVVTQERTATNA